MLTQEEIETIAKCGGQAPSGANLQPWRLKFFNSKIEILLNSTPKKTILDYGNYAALFALGCFTENIITALKALGYEAKMNLTDHFTDQQPVAILSLTKPIKPSANDLSLESILSRHTNRGASNGQSIDQKAVQDLSKIAFENEGIGFHYVSSTSNLKKVANVLGLVDAIRLKNKKLQQELFAEINWQTDGSEKNPTGIDMDLLSLKALDEKLLRTLYKFPSILKLLPAPFLKNISRSTILDSSFFAVLSCPSEASPKHFFQSGMALERIWIHANDKKIAIHPFSVLPYFDILCSKFNGLGLSPQEQSTIQSLRSQINSIFELNGNFPVFLLRIFSGEKPSLKAKRLPWQNYTEISQVENTG